MKVPHAEGWLLPAKWNPFGGQVKRAAAFLTYLMGVYSSCSSKLTLCAWVMCFTLYFATNAEHAEPEANLI